MFGSVLRRRLDGVDVMANAPMVSALEATIWCTAFKLCFQFQLAPLYRGTRGETVVWQGGAEWPRRAQGRAVQVDPIRTTLKPPGTNLLTLKCDDRFQLLLSNTTCAGTARARWPRRRPTPAHSVAPKCSRKRSLTVQPWQGPVDITRHVVLFFTNIQRAPRRFTW